MLAVVYIACYNIHLTLGNTVGRHDGIRANSNFMLLLTNSVSRILFFSKKQTYNVWSVVSQEVTILFSLLLVFISFNEEVFASWYKTGLYIYIGIQIVLLVALFVDAMIYDAKHGDRF